MQDNSALPFQVSEALAILDEATALALEMHGNVRAVLKADQTLVTEADQRVEQFLRDRLGALAPTFCYLGEEGGLTGDLTAPCWVIDPIDGTTNFANDIPVWCISVGLCHEGRAIFGMIAVPQFGEVFWAAEGAGAWRLYRGSTRRLHIADRLPLMQEDLLATNTTMERVLDFSEVPCRLRNFGSLTYHLAALAKGSLVGALAHYHKLYDVAAGMCICHEAGCVSAYLDGTPWTAEVTAATEKRPLLVAGPETLRDLEAKLRPQLGNQCADPASEIRGSY